MGQIIQLEAQQATKNSVDSLSRKYGAQFQQYSINFSKKTFISQQTKDRFIDVFNDAMVNNIKRFSFNGLLFATPYTKNTRIKVQQHQDRLNLLRLIKTEYSDIQVSDVINDIQKGDVYINGKRIKDINYQVHENDKILFHQELFKEPPVYDLKFQVVKETKDFIVIDKPASVPATYTKNYYQNTIISQLADEKYGGESSKLGFYCVIPNEPKTSGLTVFSKSNKEEGRLFLENFNRTGKSKRFFVRVGGRFPAEKQQSSIPMAKFATVRDADDLLYKRKKDQDPLTNYLLSKCEAQLIDYDANTDSSLLDVLLLSGNNSSIRYHMQHLKFPILNDLAFGGKFIGNPWLDSHFDLQAWPLDLRQQQIKETMHVAEMESNRKQFVRQNATLKKNIEKDNLDEDAQQIKRRFNPMSYLPPASIKDNWCVNRVFEIFMHAYEFRFDDGNVSRIFDIPNKPYWYDAKNLPPLQYRILAYNAI